MGFAGILPPATLTVAAKNITIEVSVPVFDFLKPAWNIAPQDWQPQSITNRIASDSAFSMEIAPFPPPVPSEYWSFDLQFYGPTVQCQPANSTEQLTFETIASTFEAQDSVFTYAQVDDTYWQKSLDTGSLVRLLYSALAPYLPVNTPGYWLPSCPAEGSPCDWVSPNGTKLIWLLTSNSSIVAIL